ncbi:MAG: TIGR04438 family Trp-rich protein [Candidatus Aquirickettsiella gammari]
MKLLILVVVLYILKLLDLSFMENISWWWINGLGLFAFLWFEFFERMLGLDKRKDEMLHEKMLKERQKRQFNIKKK